MLPDFDALWDYSQPDQTEAAFRALAAPAQESGDVSYYTQLLTQIARSEGLQRKFADAHETLDRVEQARKRVSKKHVVIASFHLANLALLCYT